MASHEESRTVTSEWVPLPIAERIGWEQGVDHTWENCYCACDPDWHYLDTGPWAPMLHCSNCKTDQQSTKGGTTVMEMNIDTALTEIYGRFNRLPASERLVEANTLIEQLREATATIAESRRAAVREMRIDGYTLREIAELIGTTTQRIHQIESGYNRHEQKARKQAD
jgi:hypothetical protein